MTATFAVGHYTEACDVEFPPGGITTAQLTALLRRLFDFDWNIRTVRWHHPTERAHSLHLWRPVRHAAHDDPLLRHE